MRQECRHCTHPRGGAYKPAEVGPTHLGRHENSRSSHCGWNGNKVQNISEHVGFHGDLNYCMFHPEEIVYYIEKCCHVSQCCAAR